jgi:hypothetical protein
MVMRVNPYDSTVKWSFQLSRFKGIEYVNIR